jgi:hypothetical protein
MQYCDDPNCKQCFPDGAEFYTVVGGSSWGKTESLLSHPAIQRSMARAAAEDGEKTRKRGLSIAAMRNVRCPCGSGLKFKRCCINKPGKHWDLVNGRVVVKRMGTDLLDSPRAEKSE